MLQRAASNAYSWWMASHIRTKQSKWMEQNLLDMEEKVTAVLKLIEEDGDSFMQKAEMYYKKRPEIINFVEEFFRAYRALADRYDHLSTDLQNANNTIAQVCPDQVRGMDDDDDDYPPRFPKKRSDNTGKVPNVPKLPVKEIKFIASTKKKVQEKKETKPNAAAVPKSGLTKEEGVGEIDRIQKRILALQTEKEFVKSSYENGLAKYREVENEIKVMQEKVDNLQDEFGEGKVIEDEEARNLMSATALKSCKDTLDQLQDTQERSVTEAEVEQKRIKDSRGKLDALKKMFLPNEPSVDESITAREKSRRAEQEVSSIVENSKQDTDSEDGDGESVTDMAEKVDQLVNKVTTLETSISSQTALIQRLRIENDELQAQIQSLEDGKDNLVDDGKHDLKLMIAEMERKLQGVQDLNHSLEQQNIYLKSHFNDAHSKLDELSEKVKPIEELESTKMMSVSSKNETKDPPKKVPKKAGAAFLGRKVTTSPTHQIESEKGSEEGQVPTNSVSTEVNSDQEAKEGKECLVPGVASSLADQVELEKRSEVQVPTNSVSTEVNSDQEAKEGKECLVPSVASSPADQVELEKRSGVQVPTNSTESDAPNELNSVPKSCNEGSEISDKGEELKAMANVVAQASSVIANTVTKSESKDHEEYAALAQNLEETKKKLMEVETKHQNELFEITLQLKELKHRNAKKDEEIRSLRLKLSRTATIDKTNEKTDETNESKESSEESPVNEDKPASMLGELLEKEEEEEEEEVSMPKPVKQPESISPVEEKLRTKIDELLEENLDFWFRFSSTLYEIQRFDTGVKDLEGEVLKLEERQKQEGSSHSRYSIKSDVRPLYKHLKEIQTELSVWIEKSMSLKEELKNRFASLCEIQEEITRALKASAEDEEFRFTSYQAAKFQGEILNMKQENNRVADELQAGLDLAKSLQRDAEKSLAKLSDDWGLSGSKSRPGTTTGSHPTDARSNVPLRSFIFGVKQKKKTSIFSTGQQRKHHKH